MECLSCKSEFLEGVFFICPGCRKEKLARCNGCKKLSVKYRCSKCNFIGP